MTAWSQTEAARTIEEVKRRSLIDPEFRALALSDPIAALARINPRPIPVGSVRFVETADAGQEIQNFQVIVAVLPDLATTLDELSDEELEDVAGGGSTPSSGTGSGTPPAGLS